MKNILLIGVGGTGSNAVDILYQKINDLGNQTKSNVTAIVFDTDVGSVETIKSAVPVSMADPASVGTICDRVGLEYIREWFPCDDKAVRSQEMVRGASQWRKKSYLAFLNLMNKPQARSAFIGALEDMSKDPSATCEVYVIASIAGGTGSGSFIPIALYARRYLRKQLGKNPIVNAMVALPDIYADSQTEDNRIKIYANAYAILRELNAIYLVSRNFNSGEKTKEKQSPVKFRIGNPNEPNVGVLFDSDDPQFWTPEAAPFTQIFVLDRIPGLKSIPAHDIVLANSLYTLICTEIGVEFDSEASNHEILRSQNNGSNAIYASVATSQMVFPVESVLDYLAHDKALSACNDEWLSLHKTVETETQKRQQESADVGRKYIPADGEYAEMVLDALKNDVENGKGLVNELVERGTAVRDEKGALTGETTADVYFAKLEAAIDGKIAMLEKNLSINIEGIETKEDFVDNFVEIKKAIDKYFQSCVANIKRMRNNVGEAIISFDRNKYDKNNIGATGNDLSLVDNLLKKDKKFIHPVSAMVQLCRLRKLLPKRDELTVEWPALRQRDLAKVPVELLKINTANDQSKSALPSRSDYAKIGEKRFIDMYNDGELYQEGKAKSKFALDKEFLDDDVKSVLSGIYSGAVEQLKAIVFRRLIDDIDLLVSKYKNFFARFEKEKEDLIEDTKSALRKDSGLIDSILNVYSTEEDKQKIKEKMFKNADVESIKDIEETDSLVGSGVFATVYNAAYSTKNEIEYNDKDAAAYRSLFTNMIDAYKKSIRKSDAYKLIASYNIVEAMEMAFEDSDRPKESVFAEYFSKLQSFATPALKVDTRMELGDLVQPSNVIVYMMSYETGKYIKKHADELKLAIPKGEVKEDKVVKACAAAFIRKYSGNDSARVSVVKDMNHNVLYCTGETMDITPLRIPKFNEISDENDNIYYTNYCKAIKNFKHYNTDMWNPHIGNDLYKRGCLPFMNDKKERIEDTKMVKALLYALANKQIVYLPGLSQSKGKYYFRAVIEGVKKTIRGDDGKIVDTTNIVQIINWLRNQDDLVEQWSSQFDLFIEGLKRSLPSITTDSGKQVGDLEKALTNSDYMNYYHKALFHVDTKDKNVPIRLLEFAYMIKCSEEASRDCDYAERIVRTSYEVFKDIIAYKANPKTNKEVYLNIYRQQLSNVFVSLAESKTVRLLGTDCDKFLEQIIGWFESQGAYVIMSSSDEESSALGQKFTYDDFPAVKAAVNNIITDAKKNAKEDEAKKAAKAEEK